MWLRPAGRKGPCPEGPGPGIIQGMSDLARDLFARFPSIPTVAAATVVLYDSGPLQPAEAASAGLRPTEEYAITRRVAGSLQTDVAWTIKTQALLSDGTWYDVNSTAVLANTLQDFNLYVAGGGRRRLVAVFGGGITPTAWLNSGNLRLISQSSTAN